MDAQMRPAVVMDCGTGFTKMGYGGNKEPSFCIPTALSAGQGLSRRVSSTCKLPSIEDTRVSIGHEASAHSATQDLQYPIRQGMVEDWGAMENFWLQSIYRYLRVDPEDHFFVLTEPPSNPPEHRECTAEIMFETFNVPGLFIGVQAVLALYASMHSEDGWEQMGAESPTGTVIDSGDGVTHVIPVVEGHVIGSSIRTLPFAGRDITSFIQQLLRERCEPVPPEASMEFARGVKENHCYVCSDMVEEFTQYDKDPTSFLSTVGNASSKIDKTFKCDIGPERFLAPEIFFNPEIFCSEFTQPLPSVVDDVIQSCPIDTKRNLYKNIVLCGGSTMFKGFSHRLEHDVHRACNNRLAREVEIDVKVISQSLKQYAAWLGGSLLSVTPQFSTFCKTKAQYQEYGPSICRSNHIFKDM